ncbi:hypothetical protein EK21DRAFT_51442 [Setomelanomma holmii]|uniref:Rhodopsin domain-containing protein n=1 Tax=Setomelanomma holmii TaxID=210430 RepID=A0A9P4HMA1_9PLEO|nr:hypothetical protein EK21DRAFT_51442 [Setomelanomma holmii]
MADNKERFDIVNGKQIALLVAPVLCFVLASAAVALRWYTRSVRRVNTLTEDALCLAALGMSFVVVTLVYILVFLCGEGLTSEEIRADPARDYDYVKRYWLRMQFALDICWATSVATVQLALVKFYVRLYNNNITARIGCYASMLLIAIWYVWSLAGWINMCHPPGKCELQSKKSCIIIGSLHVFFNAIILFAPAPAIIAAQLSSKRKASMIILFLLGCFCTILAVLRIDCAINVFGDVNHDPIGASWWRVCFSPIEIAVGIVCCCVPNTSPHPWWNRKRPSLPTEGTGLRRLKFRTTSGSSSTSNLNPAHWMPGPKAQVNAFVTLENGDKSLERVGKIGAHEIKVTKDYQLERGRV